MESHDESSFLGADGYSAGAHGGLGVYHANDESEKLLPLLQLHSYPYELACSLEPATYPLAFGLSKESSRCPEVTQKLDDNAVVTSGKLKKPKNEPVEVKYGTEFASQFCHYHQRIYDLVAPPIMTMEPFDLLSKACAPESSMFLQLPALWSLENARNDFNLQIVKTPVLLESEAEKATFAQPLQSINPYSLEVFNASKGLEILSRDSHDASSGRKESKPAATPKRILSSKQARERRQKISEKMRCLRKLLPESKKMDNGTMLKEAYKYVKFLQAQVSVLETMPINGIKNTTSTAKASAESSTSSCLNNFNDFNHIRSVGDSDTSQVLGGLSRQQLLQVLVNSPAVQGVLYSKECCIYSEEQLELLRTISEWKNAVYQQMLFNPLNLN